MVALFQFGAGEGIRSTDRILYEFRGKFEQLKDEQSIGIENLAPEELRQTRIRNDSLISIWASFTSGANNHYSAVHVYEHPDGPYILLSNSEKDKKDFNVVETTVASITGGKPRGNIRDRSSDICDVVRLKSSPTQIQVAEFVEEYACQFRDVSIPIAYYRLYSVKEGWGRRIRYQPTSLHEQLSKLAKAG